MKKAYENGCNFFDNAEVYAAGRAETVMGAAILRMYKELNIKRSDLVVSTKVFWGGAGPNDQGLSRKHIIEGAAACLQRLQLDYVDIIFCHRPDQNTPLEETVRAMNYLIDHGKAFYWGTSEWSAAEILAATHIANRLGLAAPVAEQPQYNLLHRTRFEAEYDIVFRELGYGSTTWSPLASGLLTGKYSLDVSSFPEGSRLALQDNNKWLREQLLSGNGMNGMEERDFERILTKVDALRPIAKQLNCTLAQLGLAWVLKNKNVSTVLTGASRPEQVEENFKALLLVPKLTDDILLQIEKAVHNKPTPPINYRRNL
jgi:voltage-dependent potassium channel beta subunit